MKKIIFFLIIIIISLALFILRGYSYLLISSENKLLRNISSYSINEVFGWKTQKWPGSIQGVDYILSQSYTKNTEEKKYYIKLACTYVIEGNKFDPSISFINAMLEGDDLILSFWMHRKISLNSLKNTPTREKLSFQEVFDGIKNQNERSKTVEQIEHYIMSGSAPSDLVDPC